MVPRGLLLFSEPLSHTSTSNTLKKGRKWAEWVRLGGIYSVSSRGIKLRVIFSVGKHQTLGVYYVECSLYFLTQQSEQCYTTQCRTFLACCRTFTVLFKSNVRITLLECLLEPEKLKIHPLTNSNIRINLK